MSFRIKDKVAIVTGVTSGFGLSIAKELLRNELRGLTITDINKNKGNEALDEIEKEFGTNKAIFMELDVTNYNNFEDVFKKTVNHFKNVDILVNSDFLASDKNWEKEVHININGTTNGILLGLDHYISKYKSESEGVIVNISSIAAIEPIVALPIYCGTRAAILALSTTFGHKAHYERTKVKVFVILPGLTNILPALELKNNCLGQLYQNYLFSEFLSKYSMQKPENVARGLIKVAENGESGTIWVAEDGNDPYEYILPNRNVYKP